MKRGVSIEKTKEGTKEKSSPDGLSIARAYRPPLFSIKRVLVNLDASFKFTQLKVETQSRLHFTEIDNTAQQ